MKINKDLLPIKGFNFFFHASSSTITPNIPIIAKYIGYSPTGIGTMLMTIPLLSLVTKPIIGGLADKFSLHKVIFMSLIVISSASFFAIQWFTHPPVDRSVSLEYVDNVRRIVINRDKLDEECYKERLLNTLNHTVHSCELSNEEGTDVLEVDLRFYDYQELKGLILNVEPRVTDHGIITNLTWLTPESANISIQLFCKDTTMYNLITQRKFDSQNLLTWNQFFFGLLYVLARTCVTSGYTFCDTICMKKLGERTQDFGFNRSFGALGYGWVALSAGVLIDWYSQGKYETDYTLSYYICLIMSTLALFCSFTLKFENEPRKPSLLAEVRNALLKEPQYLLFVQISLFCGAFHGFVHSFIMWYVEDIAMEEPCAESQWIKTLEGLILFVHCYIGEIGFFLLSGWMIKRLGHANCLSLVIFTFGLRFILISIVPNPWWLLIVETMNGITYATYTATAASYANLVAPSGTKATIQGISAGTYDIGTCLGTLFGGVAIDKWGGRTCFFTAGLSALGLGVIYIGLRVVVSNISDRNVQHKAKGTDFMKT